VPTTRDYKLGEDIYLLLSLPDDPQRYPVAGKVGWITPANASGGRTQGVGVRFRPTKRAAPCARRSRKRSAPRCRRPSPRRRSEPRRAARGARRLPRAPMYVDSHCHLSFPELAETAARDPRRDGRGPTSTGPSCICTTLEEFERSHPLALDHDNFLVQRGVHPDNVDVREPEVADAGRPLRASRRLWRSAKPALDLLPPSKGAASPTWSGAPALSGPHPGGARKALPLVIHTRSASATRSASLREESEENARGVFTASPRRRRWRARPRPGFYISFSGILTFKTAADLPAVAAFVPLDRCLIETDSPYLAPVPYRGKVNSPAYVPWVARQLADIKELPVEAVAEATSRNFERCSIAYDDRNNLKYHLKHCHERKILSKASRYRLVLTAVSESR
jgi:TatD DNase family protein